MAACGGAAWIDRDATGADGQVAITVLDGESGVAVDHEAQSINIRVDRRYATTSAEGESLRAIGE